MSLSVGGPAAGSSGLFGRAEAGMSGEPDLVSLLYHVDWMQLSLSAVTGDGTRVLIAPGQRYRMEAGDYLTGCDGDRPWRLGAEDTEDAGGDVHWVSGPEPPLPELLCPAWLLISSQLEVRGDARACGRDAYRVEVTRRAGLNRRNVPSRFRGGHAEVMVNAELGILLRVAWLADGAEPEVTELASLDLDPVIDPALFMPPPGSLIAESTAEALGAGGAGWTALKTVAGVAAGGLGAWIRYVPSVQKRTAEQAGDNEARISPDGPAPERSPDGRPVGLPVSAPHGRPRPLPDRLHPQRAAQPGHDCLRRAALLAGLPRQGDGRPCCPAAPRYRGDARPVVAAGLPAGRRRFRAGRRPAGLPAQRDPRRGRLATVMAVDLPCCRGGGGRGDRDRAPPDLLHREQPVRRRELLDTTATAGDFTIDIPPGLPVVEETGPPPRNSAARPRGPDVSTPR